MKIFNKWNLPEKFSERVFNDSSSEHSSRTQPNQSYTVRDLVARFANGMPLPEDVKRPIFFDEDMPENPCERPDFDLVDAMEYKEKIEDYMEKAQKAQKDAEKELEKPIEKVPEAD